MLVALLLVGQHASKLMTLLDTPISGQSTEVKLASEQWRRLQDKMTQIAAKSMDSIDLDLVFLDQSPRVRHQRVNVEDSSDVPPTRMPQGMIQLPSLSGILRCTDIYGNTYALAVIEGQRFRENEQVREFTIQKIEDKGVVLTKGGRRWFLRSPDVPYSYNHEPKAQGSGS
jgi:hypothetical protein